MKKVLELGNHFVSDFVKDQPTGRTAYGLDLYLDPGLGAVRLKEQPPHSSMWGTYWYRSGINASMTKELQGIVAEITSRVKLKDGDSWLDIACNDGTLLKAVPDNLTKLGIDPCDDSYYAESSKVARVNQTYFTKDAFDQISDKPAKVITCIAMFYDLADPHPFVQDLYQCLDDNGLLVLQMSYTPLMINQLAFDNICHEHVYYYDLTSISRLFSQHGFKVVDCSLNDTNGGSFRISLQKVIAKDSSFGSAPLRDVCRMRVGQVFEYEKNRPITSTETWREFGVKLERLKSDVVNFVRQAKAEGKTVYGYGASTKGNTLLQYFGLTNDDIVAIAERSPYKFGLRTIGTNIPIVSEEEMRAARPDYLLVLPWHFIDEFESREAEFFAWGGKMIVPCPAFKVIG
jgi:NDP-4-keto-2,6-dideoxyhexose 3-C-methyltransferase